MTFGHLSSLWKQKVSINDVGATGARGLSAIEVVKGVGGDFDVGRFPEISDVGGEICIPHCNQFNTGGFRESEDIFWSPVGVLVKSIDDGLPGVDFHNPVEHFGFVDLDDKTVKEAKIGGVCGGDEGGKLSFDVLLINVFSVGDNVDVGIFSEQLEEKGEVDSMIFTLRERRHKIVIGKIFGFDGVGFDFGVEGDSGTVSPVVGIVGGNGVAVFGEGKVDLKDAVAELVV